LISFYYSSHLQIEDNEPPVQTPGLSPWQRLRDYAKLVRGEKAFLSFNAMRFVFLCGTALSTPLFPLYYVRIVKR